MRHAHGILLGKPEERGHVRGIYIGGMITLKWMLKTVWCEGVEWICVGQV
jgi:hypothetical protein